MDNAHEHMTNVNSKMKETLQEVGRSSDKLCVDIMCIVSKYALLQLLPARLRSFVLTTKIHAMSTEKICMIGLVGLFYKVAKGDMNLFGN
jgi:hypothetical protein